METLRQLKDKAIAKLFTQFPWLVRVWAKHSRFESFSDIPWTPLKRDVRDSKLALITTGGVHLRSQPSFDMFDPNGDPTFREIPSQTPMNDLIISHNYYDHSDADKDVNIVFPIERVQELKAAGDIGDVNLRHFSLMGHILGNAIDTLKNDSAPQVARMLNEDAVDIVLLIPA